jgi:hypothetical protein
MGSTEHQSCLGPRLLILGDLSDQRVEIGYSLVLQFRKDLFSLVGMRMLLGHLEALPCFSRRTASHPSGSEWLNDDAPMLTVADQHPCPGSSGSLIRGDFSNESVKVSYAIVLQLGEDLLAFV